MGVTCSKTAEHFHWHRQGRNCKILLILVTFTSLKDDCMTWKQGRRIQEVPAKVLHCCHSREAATCIVHRTPFALSALHHTASALLLMVVQFEVKVKGNASRWFKIRVSAIFYCALPKSKDWGFILLQDDIMLCQFWAWPAFTFNTQWTGYLVRHSPGHDLNLNQCSSNSRFFICTVSTCYLNSTFVG